MSSLNEFLTQKKAKDLIPKDFKLIFVKRGDSIMSTLKVFINHKVSSVPVYDEDKKKFLGFCGILDVVALMSTLSGLKEIISIFAPKNSEISIWEFIAQENKIFVEEAVGNLINLSERQDWFPVSDEANLLEVIKIFSDHNKIRTLPVINEHQELIGVISAARIVEFVYEHCNELCHSVLSSTILDKFDQTNNWTPESVTTAKMETETIEAFVSLLQKNVSGLPIVDSEGKLCGCLSSSDIKGSEERNLFSDLYLPVRLYLDKNTPLFLRENSWKPVCCSKEDTVLTTIQKVTTQKIHRLFVCDAQNRPIHVISLAELLKVISKL